MIAENYDFATKTDKKGIMTVVRTYLFKVELI